MSGYKLPDKVPEENKEDLYRILLHAEQLQHSRIYFFLVAETIFFLAAATAYKVPFLVIVLSIAGLATGAVFTIVNLRHYWRILWLSTKLKVACPFYKRYVTFDMFDDFIHLNKYDDFVKKSTII